MNELEKIIEILKKSKSSGVYKIINPKGSIYIGSSLDIGKRFVYYLKKYNKSQIKLFNSLNKYGVENHIFEIVELIKNDDKNVLNNLLNERELYWGAFYKSLGKNNLNLKIGNRNAIVSEETKKRISLSGKGIKRTQEFKDNVSKFWKGELNVGNLSQRTDYIEMLNSKKRACKTFTIEETEFVKNTDSKLSLPQVVDLFFKKYNKRNRTGLFLYRPYGVQVRVIQ